MRMHDSLRRFTTPILVGCAIGIAPTLAVGLDKTSEPGVTPSPTKVEANENSSASVRADQMESRKLIEQATDVVRRMQADPKVAGLLRRAKGVYIVPEFTRAALGIGGEGGDGVMLSHDGGAWTGPAFYEVGGLTAGLQAGLSSGEVAFILMSDKAVENFSQQNKFSLDADAGYSVLTYSAKVEKSWGKGDVVTWSDTKGLFAGAAVGVSDVRWDADLNSRLYGAEVTPRAVLADRVEAEYGGNLRAALSG